MYLPCDLPLISVGIPVYNDEKYIATAIEDIINQSYENIEIIISDNCSTDNTEIICRKYAEKDNRIKYIRQSFNIGSQSNFKFLLDFSKGKYFMWAASDDRWNREFISKLMEPLELNSKLSVAFSSYEEIDEYGNILPGKYMFDFSGANVIYRIIKFTVNLSHRRDAFFYGLFNKSKIDKMRFVKWWWINKDIPMNCAYPVLTYILACGNYYIVKSPYSLWFNRIYINIRTRHMDKFNDRYLLNYFAFILRKFNQLYETEISIFKGTTSISICILLLPILFIRCIFDCYQETIQLISKIVSQFFLRKLS